MANRDRRRVYIVSTGQHEAAVAQLFVPLAAGTRAILESYSETELATIVDFLERLNAANKELIRRRPT